jgi:uncharacterized membrane protein
LITALIFDVIHLVTGTARWGEVSFWMISAGIIGGLVAALFGVIDWLAIPSKTRAKWVGLRHGFGNVIAVAIFAMSWFARVGDPTTPSPLAISLSVIGVVLLAVTGWLGGELVERLGVGVDDGAHVNAPSSLSGRPASEGVTPRTQP